MNAPVRINPERSLEEWLTELGGEPIWWCVVREGSGWPPGCQVNVFADVIHDDCGLRWLVKP